MKGILANPGVGPHVQATLKAYQQNNALDTFYTTLYDAAETPFNHLLKKYLPAFARQLQRRQLADIKNADIKTLRRYEILRLISAKILPSEVTDYIWEWGELAFDQWVAQNLNAGINWVHGYEHCSLFTLQHAKRSGIKSFYEQPSQHYAFFEQIAKEQFEKYPELKNTETGLLVNWKSERRNLRRQQELETADYIICNSTFTAKTLAAANINPQKIIIVPLGFPQTEKSVDKRSSADKVIFLFAGNQSLRKGTHLLFEAWQKCNFNSNKTELWLAGSNQLPLSIRNGLGGEVKFISNLPHPELMQLFKQVDVLVLPTLCDGFGMVITEAMAHGLPVITTYNSGGPDVITDGKEGFLLEAGNVEQLANRLKWCVENKIRLKEMGENGLVKAASYSWENFGTRLIMEIHGKIKSE